MSLPNPGDYMRPDIYDKVAYLRMKDADLSMSEAAAMATGMPEGPVPGGVAATLARHAPHLYEEAKSRVIEEYGEAHFMPTAMEVGLILMKIAQGKGEAKDRIAALKEYSALMGFHKEVEADQGMVVNNVMRVIETGDGTFEDFEKAVAAQQQKVQDDAKRAEAQDRN